MSVQHNSIEEWIEKTKELKKLLKDLKPEDRLSLVESIGECNIAIHASTLGWGSWVKSPKVMAKFSKKELEEIFEHIRNQAIEFLDNDIKWTEELNKKVKKEKGKRKELFYIQKGEKDSKAYIT